MNQKTAIRHIEKQGALLVFPMQNRKEPRSLWSEFFPRSKMKWEWDEEGDDRVSDLWILMKKLSTNKQVVYSKWYQGRATFFSRQLFTAMVAVIHQHEDRANAVLSREAREIYQVLEMDSPISTKELKRLTGLQGKMFASIYNRSMRELFQRQWIVGFGEVDDGAFPSLAVGATKLLFEELWIEAKSLSEISAREQINISLPEGSAFRKFYERILSQFGS